MAMTLIMRCGPTSTETGFTLSGYRAVVIAAFQHRENLADRGHWRLGGNNSEKALPEHFRPIK